MVHDTPRTPVDAPRWTYRELTAYSLAQFTTWDRHARRWANILSAIGVRADSNVRELCPGWSPKVEWALCYLEFSGHLELCDRDPGNVSPSRPIVAMMRPRYRTTLVAEDIYETSLRPNNVVVSHHGIDDLLTFATAPSVGVPLDQLYTSEHALERVWRAVVDQADAILTSFPFATARALARHVAPGGYFVHTHYASHLETCLDAPGISALFAATFEATNRALTSLGFTREDVSGRPFDPSVGYREHEVCALRAPQVEHPR
jgi:hypothetical protein